MIESFVGVGPASRLDRIRSSAKLLQLTGAGVPDVYQGSELWETSLVDPDNRRPVDFADRRDKLDRVLAGELPPLDASGAAKMLVTTRALRLRRDRPELFTRYVPIAAHGRAADHVIAFDRGGAITIATRLPVGLRRRRADGATRPWCFPPATYLDEISRRAVAADRCASPTFSRCTRWRCSPRPEDAGTMSDSTIAGIAVRRVGTAAAQDRAADRFANGADVRERRMVGARCRAPCGVAWAGGRHPLRIPR